MEEIIRSVLGHLADDGSIVRACIYYSGKTGSTDAVISLVNVREKLQGVLQKEVQADAGNRCECDYIALKPKKAFV